MKTYFDTDLARDSDGVCAPVTLLRWPGMVVTGITTISGIDGWHATYVGKPLPFYGDS